MYRGKLWTLVIISWQLVTIKLTLARDTFLFYQHLVRSLNIFCYPALSTASMTTTTIGLKSSTCWSLTICWKKEESSYDWTIVILSVLVPVSAASSNIVGVSVELASAPDGCWLSTTSRCIESLDLFCTNPWPTSSKPSDLICTCCNHPISHQSKSGVIALNENPFQSYRASPTIWDHTLLPATWHRWTRSALTSAT